MGNNVLAIKNNNKMCKFYRILKRILQVKKVLLPTVTILYTTKRETIFVRKSKSNEKITLVGDNLLKSEDNDNQKLLNIFF